MSKGILKKKRILEAQGEVCFYCKLPFDDTSKMLKMTYEHLVPQSRGGNSKSKNLALAHMVCNLMANDFVNTQEVDDVAEKTKKLIAVKQEEIMRRGLKVTHDLNRKWI